VKICRCLEAGHTTRNREVPFRRRNPQPQHHPPGLQRLPYSAKEGQTRFFGALKGGWVFKRIMDAYRVTGKHRATLLCVITHCEDVNERLAFELIHVL